MKTDENLLRNQMREDTIAMLQKPQKGKIALLVIVAIFSLGILISQVAQHHQITRLSYALSEKTDVLQKEREKNRKLRLERSVLTMPERIEKLAKKMGMTSPRGDQVRIVPQNIRVSTNESNKKVLK